ncbi:MAG: FAD-dependent protein [Bacteroidota bacterium]
MTPKTYRLTLAPEVGLDPEHLEQYLRQKRLLSEGQYYHIGRRSIDARGKRVKVDLSLAIDDRPNSIDYVEYDPNFRTSDLGKRVIIVGAGPAGMFAALQALEMGAKPIVLERGKDVQARRRDLAAINKEHIVNPDSNYCFGEGGAGTYSDGKLYTRAKKRGSVRRVFEILVAHGATSDILFESHPHIGTNKLPKIVTALRETILDQGGEIHFGTKVTDFLIEGDRIKGVVAGQEKILGESVILATGHSARDIFTLCDRLGLVEAKPFALGVRVEHSQKLIDQIQYHCETDRGPYLPAASYSLVAQTKVKRAPQRGVFSFCMCPGGFIVPAATHPGEIVVNGMSPSRRDSKYANSGIVAAIELEDISEYAKHGSLAAMQFQKEVEQRAWELGGRTQVAPAQRLSDFVSRKVSGTLLPTSYQPGLASVDMWEVLPRPVAQRLQQAFISFGRQMKGYLTQEAQIVGVESRTSSPVRIPRERDTCEHPTLKGLFPCGEGPGYAGGIVSAAMDGERCAKHAVAHRA